MKDVKDFDDVRWDDGKPTVTDYVWGRDNQTASLIRAYKDEIERLREFVSGLACDCEGEQCKVYGEDYLRLDCGYRKARAALGEKE